MCSLSFKPPSAGYQMDTKNISRFPWCSASRSRGQWKRGDEIGGCESQLWRAAVHSSVSLAPLLLSQFESSPCSSNLKYHPFTRSACPWYLLIYSSSRTVTALAKLDLVLHFTAELLMLMVRCNFYLSDLICRMTLMGSKNDASQTCALLGASPGSYDGRKGRSRHSNGVHWDLSLWPLSSTFF